MNLGIESDIQILLLIAAIVLSFGISWWTYQNNTRLPVSLKWTNVGIRTSALVILFVLLFNPFFESQNELVFKQNVAVVLDNTQSLSIGKGEWDGMNSYSDIINNLSLDDTTAVRYHTFGFDRDLFPMSADSLDLSGTITDINRSFTTLAQSDTNFDGVIFVSDGIFNRGLNPVNAASRMDIPFFVVAAGDTSRVRDVFVRSAFYNPTAFTNSRMPIRAEIVNEGFPDRQVDVRLFRNNNLVDTQTINTSENRSVHSVEFDVLLEDEGTENFRIEIPELGGEFSTENNRYNFTVSVLDNQLRILHLAFEIHPDVRALRHLLATDEAILQNQITWTGQDRFLNGPLPVDADTLDLIILHGYPVDNIPPQVHNQISSLISQTNVMLISTPLTNHSELPNYLDNIQPITYTGNTPIDALLPVINTAENDHPILDLDIPDLNRAPELRGPIRNHILTQGARALLNISFRGSPSEVPLVGIREVGNVRVSQVNAQKWHLWSQNLNEDYRIFYGEFFSNLVQWTASSTSDNLLDISTTRQSFDEGEPILFRANVVTETGSPDNDARVDVNINQNGEDLQTFAMRNLGGGRFSLDIGTLPAGNYSYEATALRGNTQIETQDGSFTVNESSLEFTDTIRRDGLLRAIAENTEGAFFEWNDMNGFRSIFREAGLLNQRTEIETDVKRAHHSYWWFVLVIFLLGTEWVIRKYYDLA